MSGELQCCMFNLITLTFSKFIVGNKIAEMSNVNT